ncbi:4Fe-4S dicluster domain-containing protein [Archaeoglobus neptunius]|uniref:4Fe-4S dicluster domain-containing protein n=1 Tax=Archaeoglobus neptunius TaxID=2798580 RepID=UPI001928D78B|nr:2-ketoglutarate ferredoxin oxidoreductase subunit delta [Archaeoglobus neptunius]
MEKRFARIYVDQALCKKCGICIYVCHKKVMDPHKFINYTYECSFCKLCELYCPDFAIEVVRVNENEEEGTAAGK